jgi:hypothetical protein
MFLLSSMLFHDAQVTFVFVRLITYQNLFGGTSKSLSKQYPLHILLAMIIHNQQVHHTLNCE